VARAGAPRRLADRIHLALPDESRAALVELLDHHMRTLWIQQEAAYYVGLAVGMRIAATRAGREGETEGNGSPDR
jgi:hypothetical protein